MPEPDRQWQHATASVRGPYRRGTERRREIVEVATEVFGEFGFRGGTLKQVADRVDGTPAAILKLFGTKVNLLLAVLDHWDETTRKIVSDGTPGLAMLDGLSNLMHYHVKHKGLLHLYTTMAAEAADPQHPAHDYMVARYRRTLRNLRGWLRTAVDAGYLRPLSNNEIEREGEFLLAAMDGLQIQSVLLPEFDLAASFEHYTQSVLDRLKATNSGAANSSQDRAKRDPSAFAARGVRSGTDSREQPRDHTSPL